MKPTILREQSHYLTTWCHYVDPALPVEEITKPGYWAHVARQLRVGDEIKVMSEDMGWRAVLIVRAVGKVEVVVQLLTFDTLGEAAAISATAESPYYVKWRGPARKFGVCLKTDDSVVKDEFQTRDAAAGWIANHLRVMAA